MTIEEAFEWIDVYALRVERDPEENGRSIVWKDPNNPRKTHTTTREGVSLHMLVKEASQHREQLDNKPA